MPVAEPWYLRAKKKFLKFWRTDNARLAAVRDVAVAGMVVLVLLASIWIYTSQPFPSQAPLVVVESGSMMHGSCPGGHRHLCNGEGSFANPGFGRVGTIDPGDLVLVKDVDVFEDVETAFGAGGRDGYGGHGDVIVFKPKTLAGTLQDTPIIHRAMLLVKVHEDGCIPNHPIDPCVYTIPETCQPEIFGRFVQERSTDTWQEYCAGSSNPITLHLLREGLFLHLDNYPCASTNQNCRAMSSGFLTKGDNNEPMDQPTAMGGGGNTCCPVGLDTIIGKARGEIPWFGLIKLSIYGNVKYACDPGRNEPCSDPTLGPQWRVLKAVAPRDLWLALFLAVALLVAVPIAVDQTVHRLRKLRAERQKGGSRVEPPSK